MGRESAADVLSRTTTDSVEAASRSGIGNITSRDADGELPRIVSAHAVHVLYNVEGRHVQRWHGADNPLVHAGQTVDQRFQAERERAVVDAALMLGEAVRLGEVRVVGRVQGRVLDEAAGERAERR